MDIGILYFLLMLIQSGVSIAIGKKNDTARLLLTAGRNIISCPNECNCTIDEKNEIRAVCISQSMVKLTPHLPNNTVYYIYRSKHWKIRLGYTNFSFIPNLKVLDVSGLTNYDVNSPVTLILAEQLVFAPLTQLRVLRINSDWEFLVPMPKLFVPLTNLEILDLSFTRSIKYTALQESLVGFRNNTVLHTVKLSNSQTLGRFLNGGTFNLSFILQPIKHCPLEELDLSYNGFRNLYPGLLTYAPNLTKVVLRNNLLYPLFFTAFFMEVSMHKTLEIADFSNQGYGIALPEAAPNDMSVYMNHEEQQAKRDLCMHLLHKHKNLCPLFQPYCKIVFASFTHNHREFCSFLWANQSQLFAGIPCEFIPKINDLLEDDCSYCLRFPSSGNLRKIVFNNLNIYDRTDVTGRKNCFTPNKLEYIDISGIFPYGYTNLDQLLQRPFYRFDNLKVANVSHCALENLYPNLTDTFPVLSELDLSYNSITLEDNEGQHFVGSPSLTKINLSHNKIQKITNLSFSEMSSLQHLNLSHNELTDFNIKLDFIPNIQIIDLRYNQIAFVSSKMMRELNEHAQALSTNSLILYLDDNQLQCTCNEREFILWLQDGKKNIIFEDMHLYKCTTAESSRILVVDVDVPSMTFSCHSSTFYIVISSGCGAALMALCGGLAVCLYRRRWWFRYRIFLLRKMYKQKLQQEDERVYEYDAFVSYNCHDELWINEQLQPKLEEKFGLKLCLHERDFELGSNIMEQISASIENSRKTLLILSPNFLASTYCHWEMNLAHNKLLASGEDVLLLAILSPMSKVKMSRILRDLLEKKTYVEWTEDPVGQQLFWDKLQHAIKTKRVEPYDLEEEEVQRRLIQE